MGHNYDFPFSIADVCSLLDLTVRRRLTNSMYVDCPFCNNGKKGKMNINYVKNTFRCNYNDEHAGGMIELYARYRGVSRSDAYREICDALRTGQPGRTQCAARQNPIPQPVETADIADLEIRHQTYSMLFSELVLTPTHKTHLMGRGLTEEQIQQQGYRSTPAFGFTQIAARLERAGCTLLGVPGFYKTEQDEWTINFNARCSGIIIPVMSIDGRIQGAQIRLDHPFENAKYIWFSSADKKMGTGSGSPVHFVGDPQCKTVFVTEGSLKGNVTNAITGKSLLCTAGVNQIQGLVQPLKTLKGLCLSKVVEANDMDKHMGLVCHCDYNPKCASCEHRKTYLDLESCPKKKIKRDNIQRGCKNLLALCKSLGLEAVRLTWDRQPDGIWAGHWKGIDDFQFAVRRGETAGSL